jgi:diguanylate cyclase (GGDEF)-like protein
MANFMALFSSFWCTEHRQYLPRKSERKNTGAAWLRAAALWVLVLPAVWTLPAVAQLHSRDALLEGIARAEALPVQELNARIARLAQPDERGGSVDRSPDRSVDRSTEICLRFARLKRSLADGNTEVAAADLQRIAGAANGMGDAVAQRVVFAQLAEMLAGGAQSNVQNTGQDNAQGGGEHDAPAVNGARSQAEMMRQQLGELQRNQQFQLDAMNHRSRLQSALTALLMICLLLTVALAWSMWRMNVARKQQALEDPLTGLKNRRFLIPFMEHETERLRRGRLCATILMLDIDHFKNVNDRWGHNIGDEALKQLSDILRNCVRNADIVARWGGEEFVIICPQSGVEHMEVICNRIRNRLVLSPIQAGETSFHLTVSIGAALFSPATREERWDASLARADQALYFVKHNGRDNWALAAETEPIA